MELTSWQELAGSRTHSKAVTSRDDRRTGVSSLYNSSFPIPLTEIQFSMISSLLPIHTGYMYLPLTLFLSPIPFLSLPPPPMPPALSYSTLIFILHFADPLPLLHVQ